ncbi:MAG: ribonuclease HI, partial [Bacteroidales bacterium]|nr:ribonuclease HI [Bacteroidales bacterium]
KPRAVGTATVLISGSHRKELSQGFRKTTNNRMELLAVIVGLEQLKNPGSEVAIYTDSKYVADAINLKWVFGWEKKRFKDKKNPDLWMRFLKIYRTHQVSIHWIKGHANIPENERCDRLAVMASQQRNLPVDEYYENNVGQVNSTFETP